MSQWFIDKFIASKEQWIIKKREHQLKIVEKKKVYTTWSTISYFGKEYPVEIIERNKKRSSLVFDYQKFTISIPNTLNAGDQEVLIQKQVEKWHKIEAKKLLPLRTYEFATEHWLKVNNVIVKSYRRKYGQCKWFDISYDRRIVQFPESVIDHIILHELAHIKHKHHKKSFRDQLKAYDKNFDDNLQRLKKYWSVIHC